MLDIMKNKKYILIIIGAIFTLIYFFMFFQQGILLNDTFLRLSKEEKSFVYKGSLKGKNIFIRVDGDIYTANTATVYYEIEDEYKQIFVVNAKTPLEYNTYVKIFADDKIKFEGSYEINSTSYFPLSDQFGYPYIDDIKISLEGYDVENFYTKPFEADYTHIVKTAFKDNIIIRGNWEMLLIAVFFLVYLIIDIKWPLFFFQLNNFLSVKDPEPTELYLTIQHASWIITPIIIFVILILGLFIH